MTNGLNLANKLSVYRILAVPFFITAVLYYRPDRAYLRPAALAIFVVAVISDFFDGQFARKKNNVTQIGSFLDPIADKLLIVSAFICLSLDNDFAGGINRIPVFLAVAVISRDALILLGVLTLFLLKSGVLIRPSLSGKACVVLEMTAVIAAIVRFPPPPYISLLWAAVLGLAAFSLLGYTRRWLRMLNESH